AALAILPRSPGYLSQKSAGASLNQKKNQLLSEFVKDPEQLSLEKKISVTFERDFSGWENFHVVSKLLKRKDLSRFIHEGKV
ncbi:hypothetical protein GUH23_05740, partial [Xanthomonas citri pv. citri]|nr:hypothetical protein [Xanthomonas citri pv. citri]